MALKRVTLTATVTIEVLIEDEYIPKSRTLENYVAESLADSIESDWPYDEPDEGDLVQRVDSVDLVIQSFVSASETP